MSKSLVPVSEVAEQLGKNKQHLFKVMDRLGIERKLEKSASARGQKIAFIDEDAITKLKEHFLEYDEAPDQRLFDSNSSGVFYLIQLEPEHDPGRFKLGFATNIEERLRAHRTAAPFSKVLNTWPCKLLWEKTAIESITRDCKQIHTEVFRHESLAEIENRCNSFFNLMPDI